MTRLNYEVVIHYVQKLHKSVNDTIPDGTQLKFRQQFTHQISDICSVIWKFCRNTRSWKMFIVPLYEIQRHEPKSSSLACFRKILQNVWEAKEQAAFAT
jgi:hypothetical protein